MGSRETLKETMSLGRRGMEPVPGYRLVRCVGRGGSGEVWSAEGPGGLPVALKLIRLSKLLGNREFSNIKILRAVRHPNLLAYFGAWRRDDMLVIGMELADQSLWDHFKRIERDGLAGIPRTELLQILTSAAAVIDYLNEPRHLLESGERVSIQHRDIKPQNIMLIGGGVKVADFGLSSLLEKGGAPGSEAGVTFAYASPEIFRRKVSERSDQYSLAVTYCLLRGGRLPFDGHPNAVMFGHLFGEPDLTMLPAPERPIIAQALAKSPEDRWTDCRQLLRMLQELSVTETPEQLVRSPEDQIEEDRATTDFDAAKAGAGSPEALSRSDAESIDYDTPTDLLHESWYANMSECVHSWGTTASDQPSDFPVEPSDFERSSTLTSAMKTSGLPVSRRRNRRRAALVAVCLGGICLASAGYKSMIGSRRMANAGVEAVVASSTPENTRLGLDHGHAEPITKAATPTQEVRRARPIQIDFRALAFKVRHAAQSWALTFKQARDLAAYLVESRLALGPAEPDAAVEKVEPSEPDTSLAELPKSLTIASAVSSAQPLLAQPQPVVESPPLWNTNLAAPLATNAIVFTSAMVPGYVQSGSGWIMNQPNYYYYGDSGGMTYTPSPTMYKTQRPLFRFGIGRGRR